MAARFSIQQATFAVKGVWDARSILPVPFRRLGRPVRLVQDCLMHKAKKRAPPTYSGCESPRPNIQKA